MTIRTCDFCGKEVKNNYVKLILPFYTLRDGIDTKPYDCCRKCEIKLIEKINEVKKNA